MNLNLVGPCAENFAPGGYWQHSENFFKELQKINSGKSHRCYIHYNGNSFSITPPIKADLTIILFFLPVLKTLSNTFKGRKIACTVFEADHVGPLTGYDQIWTATEWGKSVFIKSGYSEHTIKVVPEGIDPELYNPDIPPRKSIAKIPGFKFFFAGRDDERKDIDHLVRAFKSEFKETEPVSLFLTTQSEQKRFADKHVYHMNVIPDQLSFAGIYTAVDCFVSPSRVEGWGLPILEAMACGIPVISICYAGTTAFLNKDNAYLVDYQLEPCPLGHWARLDTLSLQSQMRYVYEHYNEAKERAMKVSEEVRKKWTWENAAKIAYKELMELL